MAGYDTNDVAELLKQIGSNSALLADAYVYGSLAGDQLEVGKLNLLQN